MKYLYNMQNFKMFLAENVIKMWHGSKRWDGTPEIQPPRQSRYEAGPGIYLTTNYETARKYAKGGGSTLLMTLKPEIRFADKVQIPLQEATKFIIDNKVKKGKQIVTDLTNYAARINSDSVAVLRRPYNPNP